VQSGRAALRQAILRRRLEETGLTEHLAWPKTYDAEYVAQLNVLDCQTGPEARLQRRAGHPMESIAPEDLVS
jgi:hypothetical protein